MPQLLLLCFSLLLLLSLSEPKPDPNTNKYTSFVKSACNTTTDPALCLKTCLPFASKIKSNPQKLAVTSLSATLTAAQSSSSAVSELSRRNNLAKYEASAVKDCIDNVGDSIDDLKHSIAELDGLGKKKGEDLKFKIANVQTWMSAAVTNEDTCMDGIREHSVNPDVKRRIRASILGVAKLTSNALCLCNHLQHY